MTISRTVSASASGGGDRENSNSGKKKTIVKPTEAQLRYAQFHHKRRTQAVKHRIDRLHQTPFEVVITIGKLVPRDGGGDFDNDNDDGYISVATEDTSDVEVKAVRLRRPKISDGRRAFLKDSKRSYRRRRRDIEQNGYRGYFLDDYDNNDGNEAKQGDDTDGDFASETDENTDNEYHNNHQQQNERGGDTSDLHKVFATLPKQQPGRRRRRKKVGENSRSKDASYQRFQAACHAMMRNIETSQTRAALPSIEVPSKRWRRSEAHVKAAAAQKQTDFYRYKTSGFVAGRKASNKNAALLLSYKYYQQNQKEFVMDRGATWLTHMPAKQSKRSRGHNYYFHAMSELPHLIQQATSFDENEQYNSAGGGGDDDDDNESLAMKKPGPQKFHRLMAYVQHRLIEKEQQEQQQQLQLLHINKIAIAEGGGDPTKNPSGQSRTFAESLEQFSSPTSSHNSATPNRIQQMADSIEGKDSTPKMKLKMGTPFSGLTNSTLGSHRRRRGKSRYVPRMRLREFVVDEGSSDEHEDTTPLPRKKLSERFFEGEPRAIGENDNDTHEDGGDGGNEFSSSPPPKMKLRDSILGQELQSPESGTNMSTSRTREMALALEGSGDGGIETDDNANSKFQQIRKSLEPKNSTPTMKLKGDFDRIDEKKANEDEESSNTPISRSAVGKLSEQFESPPEEHLEDFNRPSREVVNEFSKHIDPRIYQQFESSMDGEQQYDLTSSHGGNSHRKSGGSDDNKRQSTGSNVTEFFARIRGEQQQRQQEQEEQQQQQGKISGSNLPNSVYHPASPSGHSDAMSDLTKGSNISGLWNRGRSSISTLTSNLNTIAENQTHKGKSLLSPEVIGRATTGLFKKFRGVPEHSEAYISDPTQTQTQVPHSTSQQLGQQQKQQQQQQEDADDIDDMAPKPFVTSPSIDSHDALRYYRKQRASMSPTATENMSDASSFHALPSQIRDVVQNSGGKPAIGAGDVTKEEGGSSSRFISPNRSSIATQSTISPSELSTEQYKRAHGRFLENSQLLGGEFQHENIIDTDETQSDASDAHNAMDPQVLANLMMSPDILQKRLKQAIGSVEQRKWDQVLFLINANPWLAEMKELTTNQYLLHKLAFFGTGSTPAPMSLSEHLVEKFPSAVHKFDQDGNVPLHLASAAGNVDMIKMLGERFSSGASIRNEDGMLPLHFAIASFANSDFENSDSGCRPLESIKTVLKFFPQAVAIADNDGNLPLHVASECLRGGVGVDVVYLLMDEAERQLEDPYGARFRNKIKMEEMLEDDDDDDDETSQGAKKNALSSMMMDEGHDLHCTMVVNDFDETPLLAAIRSYKGWEMIEALVSGPSGREAALKEDSDKDNALHLLVGEFQNATAAMSILKIVPETAFHRNSAGILPIEMACMVMMPKEVILGIALVDLPINIEDRDGIKVFEDRGESWTFLTCDCDDQVDVVEEILSICSFQQRQELCFRKDANSEQNILDRATPKCREAMNKALRFLGRFEFVGDGPLFSDMQTGFKAFDALDFGVNAEGKAVMLECYQNGFDFENRVFTMFDVKLGNDFVEEVNVYVVSPEDENTPGNNVGEGPTQQHQRCVAIERPKITLKEVVQGMSNSGGYNSNNLEKRLRYSSKICSVLRLIAKALRHLHEAGVVHGNICIETCGKFEDSSWKLLERLGVQAIGMPFDPARFLSSFPPESLATLSAENDPQEREGSAVYDSDRPMVSFVTDFEANISTDIWAFGKICYESLVGKPLIDFDTSASDSPSDDVVALLQVVEWNISNMESVFAELLESGIGESGADMITACLFPSPSDRPKDMDEILNNAFWEEIRKHRSPRKGRNRRSGESVSTSVSLLTDVDRYEV